MCRVLVIGISGAGKSTFAQALADKTGLPLIHLDKEFWRPGWKMPAARAGTCRRRALEQFGAHLQPVVFRRDDEVREFLARVS
jgi:adenylate kinase family enzyme